MNSNTKGARAEGAVLGALLKTGYGVLIPFGTLRYDLAVDIPGEGLKRVQCKNGRLVGTDFIEFNACSTLPSGKRTSYHGDVDYFGVYCHELDRCYLVPIETSIGALMRLRLTAPRGRGNSPTRMAADFEIKPS